MRRVAIIGGGIAGLSAAFELEKARRAGMDISYVLYERASRLGGVIQTERIEDCIVEAGPDSFLSAKPNAAELCRELGLGSELIYSNDAQRKTYILHHGELVAIPDGMQFFVPTRVWPVLSSPLFSFSTLRIFAKEFLNPAWHRERHQVDDESVGDFVRRHFGQEMVESLVQPLLSGVYGGDVDKLSVQSVLPQIYAMEGEHGSLVRAALAARKHAKGNPAPPLFTSLRFGLQQLVDALTGFLDPQSLRLNTSVKLIERSNQQWLIAKEDFRSDIYDAVVLAVPAYVAGKLLRNADAEAAQMLESMKYTSSIIVALGFRRKDVEPPGFGFLVPNSERKKLLACTFVHNKFPDRAPADKALLRVFLNDPRFLQATDAEILEVVKRELHEILGIGPEPLFRRIFRWERAMAQYEVGHAQRMSVVRERIAALKGIHLAGNAYSGIGISDCIRTGREAARAFLAQT